MDSTLDDFFNEINEIAPLKSQPVGSDWKECVDSKTGFSYYWNTITDEVTWEEPENFSPSKSTCEKAPKYPAVSNELMQKMKNTVKIYKIASNCNKPMKSPSPQLPKSRIKRSPPKKRRQSESDDEKITLITSYGSESESEEDKEINSKQSPVRHSSDEEDDILSTVRKRAKELNMLAQVNTNSQDKVETKEETGISGFSLVAGYDSNSDEEGNINQTIPVVVEQKKESHSTLFPIVKPPDVNDFIPKENEEKQVNSSPVNSLDVKNFQRKRRLGVDFVGSIKCDKNASIEVERRGFGFNSSKDSSDTNKNPSKFYSNFTSGGVEFTKNETTESLKNDDEDVDMEKIEGIYGILHDKLSFLCEGNKNVMPVQIILIQIETLFGALRADSLKPSYLYDWLGGTSEDLIKLEKEAAPDGWILQWDRSQKRYYYHNETTGEGQWEYPESELVRQEEAMDICTTPPPPEIEERQPPLPPSPVGSPSPPPPPIISKPDPHVMPEAPSAPNISTFNLETEPLPPGVDFSESVNYKKKELPKQKDDITSAFDSFYSELAAMESTSNTSPLRNVEETVKSDSTQELQLSTEPMKKKKKKVKLGQGLSMKKKDVSKLVEKWKNVQKNY